MISLDIGALGSKWWYRDGLPYRVNGPAVITLAGKQCWYYDGKRHRTDGPALTYANGRVEYWINGNQVSEYEIMFLVNQVPIND